MLTLCAASPAIFYLAMAAAAAGHGAQPVVSRGANASQVVKRAAQPAPPCGAECRARPTGQSAAAVVNSNGTSVKP